MYGSKLNYETHVFISGENASVSARELSGVASFDIGYQNKANLINPLGYKDGVTAIAGATAQTVSFSRYLIYDDPVLDFTGDRSMAASFNYDNNTSYGFESGYLSQYSVNCAVGTVPKVSASFAVYDEMRSGFNTSGTSSTSIYIPSQGSISVTCDNSSTNRVIGFDYSITPKRKPYYTIGSEFAQEVKLIPPLEYSASVQIDVDEVFMQSGYSFLETGNREKTVNFVINGRDGNALQSLNIPNACLVGEQLTTSADGSLRLTLNYMGHQS
jgi:hypothetical protein